jgi:hypothetical protein
MVRSVRMMAAGVPPEVRVDLAHRFWSPWVWATGRSVRLNIIAVGLKPVEAGAMVRLLNGFLAMGNGS